MSKYKLDKLAQIVENSNYIMTQEEVCERLNDLEVKLEDTESKRKILEEKVKWLSEENEECFVDGQKYNELREQKDKEIQELKQQLENTEESYNRTMRYVNKTRSELLNLPKKIVEDFYDEIRHRAILEDDYCPDHNLERKYGVRKCLLEDIRTTILKKYGGEDE